MEGELKDNLNIDELGFLKVYFEKANKENDIIKPYFSRLLLLKFLFEETIKDPDLIKDKNWFEEMRDKLNTEFIALKNGVEPIKINGKIINSLEDLTMVRNEARANQQAYYNFRPVVYSLGALYVAARISSSKPLLYLLAVAVILSSIYYVGLQSGLLNSNATLFRANQAERVLQQVRGANAAEHNERVMNDANIKKFFLLSDDELKVFNKGPELR